MYEKLYKEFENEIGTAVASYLLWKEIHNSTADKKILSAFNRTPTSWIIIRHSLQVTFLITLHRIFETGQDVVSAEKLLGTCVNDISIFDTTNLRIRKDPESKKPEWLDDYISNAYVPTVQDINMLRGELNNHRNVFNNIYRPIRNKVIAHNMLSHLDKSNELYAKTNIDEIERILEFLNALKETLFELYINGKKPDITKHKLDKRHYVDDSKRLISSIASV